MTIHNIRHFHICSDCNSEYSLDPIALIYQTHTCLTPNTAWTRSLFNIVLNFRIGHMTESDHFPLVCELLCNVVQRDPVNDPSAVRPFCRYKWDAAKRDGFLARLTDETSVHDIEQSMRSLNQNNINRSRTILKFKRRRLNLNAAV